MQTARSARVLVLALLALGAGAARRRASTASQSTAREWLRSHGPAPPQDELQELKAANPEAYAIVKALLTKRALGLLDPRHPTASFASAPAAQTADNAPPMSSVDFAASVGVKASSGAAPEATDDTVEAAPPPAHHSHKDWLNWRPSDSAAEDDSQVQQVLGQVSQLRAGGAATAASAAAGETPTAPQPPAARPPAAQAQENSYLKGLDLGGQLAPEPVPPSKQQGLVGVRQDVSQDSRGGDDLKDFSWSDGGAAASRPDADAHPLPPARIVSQDAPLPAARILTPFGGGQEAAAELGSSTPAPRKQNALVSWLGSSWGPVKAPPAAADQSAASTPARRGAGHYSQYLKDLAASA